MSYLDWHVGMKIVCVDNVDDELPPNPKCGQVYTISWIGAAEDVIMVDLLELPNPDSADFYRGYSADIFRKVQPRKTDISCFTAILNGHRVPEDA